MFEKETEQLIGAVRQATIGDAKAIGLREVFESNIPASVKVFFRAEVEAMLDAERKPGTRSGRFKYDLPEIAMLQNQINTLLIHNFVFQKDDFETTLDKCVHFMLNYLCRPQWTLNSFLFEESGRATSEQILKKLKYCRDYGYFPDILRKYFGQRGVGEITLEEGRNLIARIDAEVVKGHTSTELAQITVPLFEFIAYARSHKLSATPRTIPTRALIYFFEDKKMGPFGERLARERDVNNVKEISFHQLANLLEKVRTGDEHASLFDDNSEPLPASDDSTLELPIMPGVSNGIPAVRPAAAEPPKPLPPVFSLDEERSIIKYVFHQNEETFRNAMQETLAATTWDEAALTIDHYFLMNDVEPFTKEAILFTNRLQNRFIEKNVSQ